MDLGRVARVVVSSVKSQHPLEAALVPGRGPGWRVSRPGPPTVRLVFDGPRPVRLRFVADAPHGRRSSYSGGWTRRRNHGTSSGSSGNSPSAEEVENHRMHLPGVIHLELVLTPDISGRDVHAPLAEMRVTQPVHCAPRGVTSWTAC
jgi:hypothetical protein